MSLRGSFGVAVSGAASSVARLAGRDEVGDVVAAACVMLEQVVGFGCWSFLAPVADGFFAE